MGRVITLREILALLDRKITEPTEGQSGQHLDTDGAGGRYWSGTGQTVAAQKLRIGGEDYIVRTGASGEAGYLTIGANAIWLGTHQVNLDLDGQIIIKMYGGTSLIYEKNAASAVVFDNGYVDGIPWSGNLLTRPNYTTQGRYDLSLVESNGYMTLLIYANEGLSDVQHNSHVCTTNFVSIPANATRLRVEVSANRGYREKQQYLKFGLLPADYVNSTDASRGGQMSQNFGMYAADHAVYDLTLAAGIAGTDTYRVVINLIASAKDVDGPNLRITKVWFE